MFFFELICSVFRLSASFGLQQHSIQQRKNQNSIYNNRMEEKHINFFDVISKSNNISFLMSLY